MLSVVIATHNSERSLLPTLAALVQGAAAGIVREVVGADAGARDATAAIADGAGCRVLVSAQGRGARLKTAADAARASWLLFLRPGVVLDATWVDETRRFVEQAELQGCAGIHAAVFRVSAFRPGLLEALALLGTALGAKPDASQGLVIANGRRQPDSPPTSASIPVTSAASCTVSTSAASSPRRRRRPTGGNACCR